MELAPLSTSVQRSSDGVVDLVPPPQLLSGRTLNLQCQDCYEELRRLEEAALDGTEISTFAKTILRPLASRIGDLRLRLDIWRSDIKIDSGILVENYTFKESSLYRVVVTAFERMRTQLGSIDRDLTVIKDGAQHMVAYRHAFFQRFVNCY